MSNAMLLGIIIMLAASASFNSAPIFLRIATRSLHAHSGPALLRAALTRKPGLLGLALSLLGWGLEVVALTLIPLTLGRIIFAAGLALLLVLAARALHEPLGRRELLGTLAIVAGAIAVATAPPAHSTTPPTLLQWLVLLALLGPVLLAPSVRRMAGRHAGWLSNALAAGVGYALAALFNKGLANLLLDVQLLPLLLVFGGAVICAALGFMGELDALKQGHASSVTPAYRALQTVIPIACAPAFFGEQWPADAGAQGVLLGGILVTLVGILIVSGHRGAPQTEEDHLSSTPEQLRHPALGGIGPLLKERRPWVVVELVLLVLAMAFNVVVALHPGPLPGDVEGVLGLQHWLLPHKMLTTLLDQVSSVTWPQPALYTLIGVVALLVLLRRWLDAIVVAVLTSLGSGSSYLTNLILQRPRPSGHGVYVLRYITDFYSFPSGHVEHAVTFFGFLLFLTFQVRGPARWLLWPVRVALLAMIVLMGPSRMLEGQHWTSDSLQGLLYGAFWLLLGIQAYRWAAHRWPRLAALDEGKQKEKGDLVTQVA